MKLAEKLLNKTNNINEANEAKKILAELQNVVDAFKGIDVEEIEEWDEDDLNGATNTLRLATDDIEKLTEKMFK